ncbi:MAG: DUF551 domain-containing protein [Klebsiella aerogenes]|nr:DUF551 domain-containing protein [Klebsiella aerogenes]
MTSKLTITDERITSVIERLEHFSSNLKWTDVRGAQDMLTAADGLRELQERRKADSEPVAVCEPIAWLNDAYLARGVVDGEAGSEDAGPGYIPVYREAQPAPVVPDAYVRDERGAMMLNGKCEPRIGFGEGWNACRAAMLQSEPVTTANKLGNSPVIPDTWIPVSERLPEEGGRYWFYVEEQNSLGESHYQWNCSWNGEIWGGAMMYGRVTHWMPLPNPPKEEK